MTKKAEPEPSELPVAEVEITVAGHTIIVKAAAPISEVSAEALALYRKTRLAARKIPFGFDISAGQIERAEQPDYVGQIEQWGEEEDAGLGGEHPPRKPAA